MKEVNGWRLGGPAGSACRLTLASALFLLVCGTASAQVTHNVNVTGSPAPNFDWEPYRQENEVSCGDNPDNELIKLCAYNWYGYADTVHGDAWIAMSTTRDGENWTHQPITGHAGNDYLGFDAAADPTVLMFPGGAFITSIVLDRGGNSKMVVQRLVEMNRETGSPYAMEDQQQIIADFNGVNFIDKPDAELIAKVGGGFTEVTITLDEIDDDPDSPTFGEKKQVTRLWPEFTVCVAYAVFGGSKENVRTFATCSDGFAATGSFSNPRQITQSADGGLDQGLTIASIGDEVLYVTRRFDSGDGDAIIGAIARDRGYRPGKVFEISDICPMDQHTAPSPENPYRIAPRSLDFPWISATDTHYALAYVDRPRDALGNCLPSYENIGGSRVMIRTSTNGTKWSDAVPVVPFEGQPVHFHLQPNIVCARGACNVVYYSTINESIAYEALLKDVAAENYWETNEFVEDFDVFDPQLNQVLRFRRSVDVLASEIRLQANGDPLPQPPIQVSQYQLDYNDLGESVQIEWNSLGNLIFGGMTQPFHGDYLANTTNLWFKDPLTGVYGPNAAPIGPIDDEINRVRYFAAWTDNRRIRGFVYNDDNYDENTPPAALPYEVVESQGMVRSEEADAESTAGDVELLAETTATESDLELPNGSAPGAPGTYVRAARADQRPDRFASAYAFRAEGPADPNPNAPVCQPGVTNFPQYPGFQTNAKNSEIYGATIDTQVRLVSPNVGKNLGNFNPNFGVYLQRGFVMGVDNLSLDESRLVRLVIAGQPGEEPVSPGVDPVPVVFPDVRASWRQLPFGNPGFDPTIDPLPRIEEIVEVQPLSLEYVTLFVVAPVNDAPVTVYAYDANTGDFISQLTVNGVIAAGDLIDPGTTAESVNLVEIHDPSLIEPIWADLEILPLNESYQNPNFRSPNYRSPNYRNTDYMDPNMRSADLENPNYRSTTTESTSLSNPNLRSPNLRSDSFVDVTYEVYSENNTITAVNADFAYGGDDLDGDQVQVIAWKEDQLMTAQGCEDGFITENKVISAKANPNLRSLAPADIEEPFQGTVTFPLEPRGSANVTIRIFCNEEEVGECSNLVDINPETGTSKVQSLFGYNFWSQKANTGSSEITKGVEAVTKDVIPPLFEPPLQNGTTFVSEATGPDGATVDIVNDQGITANDNGEPVDVSCQLFIEGQDPETMPTLAPLGESGAQCDTDADSQGNVGTWTGFVLVEDNTAPVINVPGGAGTTLTVAPTSASGAMVDFLAPGAFNGESITVTEAISPDAVTFNCSPESGSEFPVGDTVVSCTASDAGPCDPSNSACVDGVNVSDVVSFTVSVVDNDAPVINDDNQLPDFGPVEATAELTPVNLPLPSVLDIVDEDPIITNDAPATGFPLGDTIVIWTVEDFSGNQATATQKVIVRDTTAPVITVPGDITQTTASESGTNVDFNVSATDIFDVTIACEANGSPVQSGDLFAVGDTTVSCTATDASDNESSDQFTITVDIEYVASGVIGKLTGKTGSSFPVSWTWQNDRGENVRVGVENQTITLREGSCPGGLIAQDPGNSGVREMSDGSYETNIQAVDEDGNNLPAERPSTPYCITVTLTTNGQQQFGTMDARP